MFTLHHDFKIYIQRISPRPCNIYTESYLGVIIIRYPGQQWPWVGGREGGRLSDNSKCRKVLDCEPSLYFAISGPGMADSSV